MILLMQKKNTMKNFRESKARANQDNNGMILSPLGNMYYMPKQNDPASYEGDVLKLHCKLAWSYDSEKLYWPMEMQLKHYSKVKTVLGVIPLDYTMENYIFPKNIEGVKVEITEEPGKWILNFKNLGEIIYIPEHGIAFIQGDSKNGIKSIYKAIYKMYESHCTIVTKRRAGVNLNNLFA
ncbi:hypothetical protein PQY73_01435 [Schleiferiaceae bacterium]|nr:hypothetical protein [Schleiferiaceae bacterium]